MANFGQLWRRLLFLLDRERHERELQEEMRLHAQLKAEKNAAAGMGPQEAQWAAQRQLGNALLQQERSREQWGFAVLESVVQDVKYGMRGLRNAPVFTTVAMLTLALGIGSTAAIFSIVNAVMLRPLPYKDSARIVNLWTVSPMFPEFQMGQSAPNLADIRARTKSFETIAAYQPTKLALTGSGEPEQISASAISPSFLDVFGIHPAIGRPFVPDDENLKSGNVVLLSSALWRRRFGSDPGIVGKTITLDQKGYTVCGVLPAGFNFPTSFNREDKTEAWIPLHISPEDQRNRMNWRFFTVAKLRAGIPLKTAQAEMDEIAAVISHNHPEDAKDSGLHFPVATIQAGIVGDQEKRELLVLLAAVGFLLLIACANVSNLVLSRGVQRKREIAVRAALGATRKRIFRQLLVESTLLSMSGGAAGLFLAAAAMRGFRSFAPADFPRLQEIHLEAGVAVAAFVIAVIAAILCGVAPAIAASKADLNTTVKERTPAAAASGRFSLRSFLVATEVALAMVLLTGSALMVQSLVRLLKVDTGLHTANLVTAQLTLSSTRYHSDEQRQLFNARLFDALRAQPQFNGVALSNNSILEHNTALINFDPSVLGSNEKAMNLEAKSVSPGYFETLGIPVLRGRAFTEHDRAGAPQVVLINESLRRKFFTGRDPLGQVIKFSPHSKDQYQIVGVVADTRDISLGAKPRPQIYFPLLQDSYNEVHMMVRSSLDAAAVTTVLQQCVWSVDKDEPLRKVRSMSQVIAGSVAEPRFRTWLLGAFAIAGLALTLIGIYGVISYSVAQRTNEMGIRIALGAQPFHVLGLVLRQGVRLTLAGAAAGLMGSLLLTRLLESQLYDIKPNDPATLLGAALAMLLVAIAASYIPARRATRVDPMVALRYE